MLDLAQTYTKKLQGAFETGLRKLEIVDGEIDLGSVVDQGNIIWAILSGKQTKKHPVANYLVAMDVILQFQKAAIEVLRGSNPKRTGKLSSMVEDNKIREEAEKFISFVEALPYDHDVYFEVKFDLPPDVHEIILTDNVKIIRVLDPTDLGFEKQPAHDLLSLGLMLYGAPKVKAGETYICCKGQGFSGKTLSGSATKVAYRLLKQFSYFSVAVNVLEYYDWNDTGLIEPKAFFVRHGPGETPVFLTLPHNTKVFLSKLIIANNMFDEIRSLGNILAGLGQTDQKEMKFPPIPTVLTLSENLVPGTPEYIEEYKNRFKYRLRQVTDFLTSNVAEKRHIERAIEWGYEGLTNHDDINGFIQCCIGLEAILGHNMGRADVNRLADRCAYLLGRSTAQRDEIFSNFLKIYDLRSQLVHGNSDEIDEPDGYAVVQAEEYLKRCILREARQLPR